MSLSLSLVEAITSLRSLGRRAILALLGIVIGSASITALLNIGQNAADEAARAFRDMGINMVVVRFWGQDDGTALTPDSLALPALQHVIRGISQLSPVAIQPIKLRYQDQTMDSAVIGTTANLQTVVGLPIRQGRFFSSYDDHTPCIVIGAEVADKLSSGGRPLTLGSLLQLGHYLLPVIGILDRTPANSLLSVDLNSAIIVPYEGMTRIKGQADLTSLIVKAEPHQALQPLAAQIQTALTGEAGRRNVQVEVPEALLEGLKRQSRTFSYLLAALAAISLLLGGIGIMNVMMMNVTERRGEIGIRMAIGARPRDIGGLFLLEAASLSVSGSLFGSILGFIVAYAFSHLSGWQFSFAITPIALGCGSSLLTGLFFGLYPAMAAAKLHPAQALRND